MGVCLSVKLLEGRVKERKTLGAVMANKVIPKPQLRNLLLSDMKNKFMVATGIALAVAIGLYFSLVKPRNDAIAEYDKNFDFNKEFKRLVQAGVYETISKDGVFQVPEE